MDQVNVNASFTCDDVFERQKYAEMIMKLVQKHDDSRGACAIAVDAPWGIGKTTFLHMFRNEIDRCHPETEVIIGNNGVFTKEERVCVYYNAWEYDDYEDAFSPLLWAIVSTLDPESTKDKKKSVWLKGLKNNAATFVSAGVAMALHGQGTVIANHTANIVKAAYDGLSKAKPEDALHTLFSKLRKEMNDKKDFHDALAGLAKASGKLFVFIDELDRCKPTFAIDTLETIKHYFDVPNVVFVFGVDMTQLSHAINGRYGGKMDAGGYLTKFFDHHLRLNNPTAKQMIHTVDEDFSMSKRQEEDMESVFHACDITPREIRKVYMTAKTLQNTLDTSSLGMIERAYIVIITMLFMCMKYRKPNVYAAYMMAKGEWDYENWRVGYPKLYAFLDKMSGYRTLMVDQAYERFEALLKQNTSLSIESEISEAVSRFGLAVLDTRNGRYAKTFIQIMQEWLESVVI